MQAINCPFGFSEALDFDPALAGFMERESLGTIRLPYGDSDAWLVTRFESVQQVTTDPRFSRAAIIEYDYPRLTPEPIVSPESINVMDPPYSGRIRHLATQAFTPRQVDRMRGRIGLLTDRLLDEMEDAGQPADLVRYLSDPLPQHTILDLLGIDRAEWPRMQEQVQRLLVVGAGNRDVARAAKEDLTGYFTELVAERRNNPGADIISVLTEARDGTDQLDDRELAVLALTFTLSGQDTATCQISDIMYLLLTRPKLAEYARAHRKDLTDFIHELLRYIPFRKGVGIPRVALEDVEMDGVVIRQGDFVHVSYLTANRDPDRYPDPHEIVPDRPVAPHMTFGWGGHRCIAVPLAMAELEVALERLLDRFPTLRLAVRPEEIRWDTETIRRFPLELPVAW